MPFRADVQLSLLSDGVLVSEVDLSLTSPATTLQLTLLGGVSLTASIDRHIDDGVRWISIVDDGFAASGGS